MLSRRKNFETLIKVQFEFNENCGWGHDEQIVLSVLLMSGIVLKATEKYDHDPAPEYDLMQKGLRIPPTPAFLSRTFWCPRAP